MDKLRTEAAARYLGLARSTLAKMWVRGDGPPYSKAGSRVVVYDIRDLDDWLRTTRRTSTRTTE
jgi:predicted DNA-binding transcriptional regulator AlpA